jgi:hypothetical protein
LVLAAFDKIDFKAEVPDGYRFDELDLTERAVGNSRTPCSAPPNTPPVHVVLLAVSPSTENPPKPGVGAAVRRS